MTALSFPIPTSILPEFKTFEEEAAGDSFKQWYLVLNNFHFNLPYFKNGKIADGISVGYYHELCKELGVLEKANRFRITDGNKLAHSAYFLDLNPRMFYEEIALTIAQLGYQQEILRATTLRMYGNWEHDRSWLHPIGMLYTSLRLKGFTRADLAT